MAQGFTNQQETTLKNCEYEDFEEFRVTISQFCYCITSVKSEVANPASRILSIKKRSFQCSDLKTVCPPMKKKWEDEKKQTNKRYNSMAVASQSASQLNCITFASFPLRFQVFSRKPMKIQLENDFEQVHFSYFGGNFLKSVKSIEKLFSYLGKFY